MLANLHCTNVSMPSNCGEANLPNVDKQYIYLSRKFVNTCKINRPKWMHDVSRSKTTMNKRERVK